MFEVTKCAVQEAIIDLGTAFRAFFEKRGAYRRFKKRGVHDSFCAANETGTFGCDGKRIKLPLDRYRGENGNFVRVLGLDSRSFEADRAGEGIEIVDNALIKAIELRSVFGVQANITADRAENAGSKRGIDALEEFQKDEAN